VVGKRSFKKSGEGVGVDTVGEVDGVAVSESFLNGKTITAKKKRKDKKGRNKRMTAESRGSFYVLSRVYQRPPTSGEGMSGRRGQRESTIFPTQDSLLRMKSYRRDMEGIPASK